MILLVKLIVDFLSVESSLMHNHRQRPCNHMDFPTPRTSILASRYRLPVLLAYTVTNTALHTAW
jgi:hypothetical protein